MEDPIKHLEELQKWRAPRGGSAMPGDSIRSDVARLRGSVERHVARFGDAAQLWESCIPNAIWRDTRLSGLSGGVLTVITGSAATSFELDRVLRSGAQEKLRAGSRGRIARVRMRVGSLSEGQ